MEGYHRDYNSLGRENESVGPPPKKKKKFPPTCTCQPFARRFDNLASLIIICSSLRASDVHLSVSHIVALKQSLAISLSSFWSDEPACLQQRLPSTTSVCSTVGFDCSLAVSRPLLSATAHAARRFLET